MLIPIISSILIMLLIFFSFSLGYYVGRCEASRASDITNSFNNKGNGTQDFTNTTIIIINGGWSCCSMFNLQAVRWFVTYSGTPDASSTSLQSCAAFP
ncbi:unnamed protein product, partial [Sphenostylis stenocarpa]